MKKTITAILCVMFVCALVSLTACSKGDVGPQGAKGDKGDPGENGIGIVTVKKTASENNIDVYKIKYSNGTESFFTVTNGKDGVNGTNGADGKDGKDGVGITDVTVNSSGEAVLTMSNGSSLNIGKIVGTNGKDGANGINGKDGVGIEIVTLDESGNLSVKLTSGTILNLGNVKGADGKDGANGTNGVDGKDGVSVTKSEINEKGELVLTYSNGQSTNLGKVVGSDGNRIIDITFNENGELIVGLNDNTKINCGNLPVCDHVYSEMKTVVKASCTSVGVNVLICSKCNCEKSIFVDKEEHVFGEAVEIISNCTVCVFLKRCINCDMTQLVTEGISNHIYNSEIVPPTCMEFGYTRHTCYCGDSYDDTYIEALGHNSVVDPEVPATFAATGLAEGSHCDVCGIVIVEQQEIPALGSNVVAGTDYYDDEEATSYRYSYSLSLSSDDEFTLTTLTVGSDNTYSLEYDSGKLCYISNQVYELVFDSHHEPMYVRFENGKFKFCNRDGSKWDKKQYERPEGVTTVDLIPRDGNSSYGYYDLANNKHGQAMQELYYRLYYVCEAFVNSNENIENTDGYYVIDTINLDNYVITASEAVSVWKIFYVENPRYYWLANSITISNGKMKVCVDENYATSEYRTQCDVAIEEMVNSCNTVINVEMTELEKSLLIHDFILEYMNYAYESDGVTPENDIWAHNMVGCAKYNLGVCESYAKTYMYLCLLNDIECIVVTGEANGAHAWNLVSIDGIWYGVDCTWDETNLPGVLSYNCFGMNYEYLNSNHIPDTPMNSGVNYLYMLPDVSKTAISLVDVYEDDKLIGTVGSMDDAVKLIVDSNKSYTLELYLYENKGILLLSKPPVEYTFNGLEFPCAQSITITGKLQKFEEYSTSTLLYLNKDVTVNSDVNFVYILVYGNINLNGNSLYAKGWGCFGGDVIGENSTVTVEGCIEFRNFLKVKNVIANLSNNSDLCIRGDAVIENLYAANADFNLLPKDLSGSFSKIIITNLYMEFADSAYNNLYSCGRIGIFESNVTIDNIYSQLASSYLEIRFEDFAKYPLLNLNNVYSDISVVLSGTVIYSFTDAAGNEVWREIIKCNPFDENLEFAIFKQENIDDFSKVNVFFEFTYEVVAGYVFERMDCTEFFGIDNNGFVYRTTSFVWDNLLCVQNGILLSVDFSLEGNVEIPDEVKIINQNALSFGNKIKVITLHNEIESIGSYAFSGCTSLEKIIFEGTIAEWEQIEKHEWWKDYSGSFVVECADGIVTL